MQNHHRIFLLLIRPYTDLEKVGLMLFVNSQVWPIHTGNAMWYKRAAKGTTATV